MWKKGKRDRSKKSLKFILPPTSSGSSYMLFHEPEPNGSSFSRQIIPKETANDLHKADILSKYYSYQMLAVSEARSTDEILKGYNRPSPSRNFDELKKGTPLKSVDAHRGGWVLSDEILDASRLQNSPLVTMKATSQAGNLIARAVPRSGILQLGEEPQTVVGFLHSLGLGKYSVTFQAEELDMTVLKRMGDKDLKEMGIPMGPRKKIPLALLARLKRQAL